MLDKLILTDMDDDGKCWRPTIELSGYYENPHLYWTIHRRYMCKNHSVIKASKENNKSNAYI